MGQFVDLGPGLPMGQSLHDIVTSVNRESRVLSVEQDPVVAARLRALLVDDHHVIEESLTNPVAVLTGKQTAPLLDLHRPVAALHVSTLHYVPDSANPAAILGRYIDLLPSGSYIVLSHFCDPQDDQDGGVLTATARRLQDVLVHSPLGAGYFRTRDEITSMLTGLRIVQPHPHGAGVLTPLSDWWPEGPRTREPLPAEQLLVGAVAHKP